jgi:hypothetical protein
MADKHERFSHYCAGIQAIALTLALLVGGVWTVILYSRLHEAERASAELLVKQAEVNKHELERQQNLDRLQQTFGQISLSTSSLAHSGRTSCYLQVVARITNQGTRQIRLRFNKGDPLRVAEVSTARDGKPEFRPIASAPVQTFSNTGRSVLPLPSSKLLPDEGSEYPFIVRVQRNRLYLIQFSVPVDTVTGVGQDTRAAGWYWTARTYSMACTGAASSRSAQLANERREEALPYIE